jgi:hypothetical protein
LNHLTKKFNILGYSHESEMSVGQQKGFVGSFGPLMEQLADIGRRELEKKGRNSTPIY